MDMKEIIKKQDIGPLADYLNCSRQFLYMIRHKKRKPSYQKAKLLELFYGIKRDCFMEPDRYVKPIYIRESDAL